jgi:hypothetical protein
MHELAENTKNHLCEWNELWRPQVQIEARVLVRLAGQLGWRSDIVLLPCNAVVLFCAQRALAFLDTTSYFLPVRFALAW